MVCMNWLLSDGPLDLETELTVGFLDHLLLGTPASPLRKILLESNFGDAIVGGGVEDELLQPQFSIGLKGVAQDDISKVEELVMNTLASLAKDGFTTEAVEASMNTIEFSLRENNTGSFPRGLSLMLRSIVCHSATTTYATLYLIVKFVSFIFCLRVVLQGKWIYDRDPFEPLMYDKPLLSLKERINKEGSKAVFTPIIEKYILNNSHRVTIEMQVLHGP